MIAKGFIFLPRLMTRYLYPGLILVCWLCSGRSLSAQEVARPDTTIPAANYDQINVLVMVEKVGQFYIDILVLENEQYFVNIEDLFRTLKIYCVTGQRGDSIGGSVGADQKNYLIDFRRKTISAGSRVINSPNGLIKENGFVFVESSLVADAFGLIMTFNQRSLAIILKSSFELPVVRLMRQERIRANLSRFTGEVQADTIAARNYHLFRGGAVDWYAGSTQSWGRESDVRVNLKAGAELLYGEAQIGLDYYSRQPLTNDQLRYLWRWVDNDKRLIRQALAGTIQPPHIAFFNSNLMGAMVRNTPTTVRKSSGYYTVQETTEPDWIVELYINDILIDFTRSDASGQFVFKVPLVYGTTTLKLKFYGPLGEERTEERSLSLPYSFLPEKEFEYSISGGFLQNKGNDLFGRADFNYGLFRYLTIGAGAEYLSSLGNRSFLPFARFTLQPYQKLIVNGEYVHGVRAGGTASIYFLKSINLEMEYQHYVKNQIAVPFKPLEERKAGLMIPFRIKSTSGYFRAGFYQQRFTGFDYIQAIGTLSYNIRQFSINSTTQVTWSGRTSSYPLSDLSLSYRFTYGFTSRLMAQYDFRSAAMMSMRGELEKRFRKGIISAFYERNFLYNDHSVNLSFRYDLPFSRANTSVSMTGNNWTTSQGAQGGFSPGSGKGYLYSSYNAQTGKGGVSLYPFLDANHNGLFDPGEKMVRLRALKIMGSKVLYRENDSVIRLPELNPFTRYVIEFSDNDLENLAWRFVRKKWSVLIDPNQFKRVDVPVIPVGEVSGMVYMERGGLLRGTGRLLVNIYHQGDTVPFTRVMTESDGYLYFLGLPPGVYTATVDPIQLSRLGLTVNPPVIEFTIRTDEDGDIVEGVEFILREEQENPPEK